MAGCTSSSSYEEYQHWMSKINETNFWEICDVLKEAPEYIRDIKKIVMVAVQKMGLALEFASPSLKNDREVVLAAVNSFGLALQFASPSLRNDKKIVMAAIKGSRGKALQFASPSLRNDKKIVTAAVQYDPFGQTLQYASPSLQNDKEIVMAVVKGSSPELQFSRGKALQFASPSLRNDKTIVMAAVQNSISGKALQFASPDFKDKDVALIALKIHPDNIKYVHEDLKKDRDVLIAAGMFDEDHNDAVARQQATTSTRKITLSTRFSLNRDSNSAATEFTSLLKVSIYIQDGNFVVYAPNAFNKRTCDPEWTDFNHPCRGTNDTCNYDNILRDGHPTDDCCWRYSFRCQLQEAKDTGGFMLQLVETGETRKNRGKVKDATLGKGQRIELDMANAMQLNSLF